MTTKIGRRYELIAGHWLPYVADDHKCKRKHGHNYVIEIALEGEVRKDGFILDFYDLDNVVNPLLAQLDHTMLNEHEGLENPTAELIAEWFYRKLEYKMDLNCEVSSVTVWETKDCWASYCK